MRKIVIALLMCLTLTALFQVTPIYGQSPPKPESTSTTSNSPESLTDSQLRKALFVALKEKKSADEKLALADEALKAAEQQHAADESVKQALRNERDTYKAISESRQAEIQQLAKAIDNYQNAVKTADQRADNAEREVTRQKGKVKFWKNLARAAILAAFVLGAAR